MIISQNSVTTDITLKYATHDLNLPQTTILYVDGLYLEVASS